MNKQWILCAGLLLGGLGSHAGDIVVSWESNGVLVATGMEPGTTSTVEWASNLMDGFTNASPDFEGLVADSNGTLQVAIPLFFRVVGTPKQPIPEGMVAIPAGTNSGTDPDFGAYSLANATAFYMDQYEVTRGRWNTVFNWAVAHGYSFNYAGSDKPANHPVHNVNWYDCVKWCNARSEMEGKTVCYTVGGSPYKTGQSPPDCDFDANGYRLPTIGEWEYAARGGLQGKRFPWGNAITHNEANYYSDSSYGYDTSTTRGYHPLYDEGGHPHTSPVGSFSSNGYGLCDMSGNVWEWCNTESDLPWGYRNLRGGSWYHYADSARCGHGYGYDPDYGDDLIGFRAVRR